MKIVVTGDVFDYITDIGGIDGRIYPVTELQPVFDSMVNGIFVSPEVIDAEWWIDTNNRAPRYNVVLTGDHNRDARLLRRTIAQVHVDAKRRVEGNVLNHIPASALKYVSAPTDLPRKVYFDGLMVEDWTPFSFFANPTVNFFKSDIDLVPWESSLLDDVETDVTDPRIHAVTQYARDRWDELSKTQVENKMNYAFHQMKEGGLAVLLPPPGFVGSDGRSNTTGQHGLLFGSELFKKFATELCRRRMARVDDVSNVDDAIAHAYLMRQDYSSWAASVQQVYQSREYMLDLDDFESDMLGLFSTSIEMYFSYIERNVDSVLTNAIDRVKMSMKPLKSPGTDIVLPDGAQFVRKDAWYYPSEAFNVGHHEHNAYASFSYKPIKDSLIPYIVPSERERMRGLLAGKLHDPKWEFEMVMKGCSREGTVAWRINAPDKPAFRKLVNGKWIVDEQRRRYVPDYDSGDWIECQGKEREICHETENGFRTRFVSPVDVALEIQRQEQAKTYGSGQKASRTKAGMLLRARLIMPHKWRFNMFDGTIAKLFAIPMEHCRCGFPNLKVGSLYEMLYRAEVGKMHAVPWAFDISHFETFSSSNPEIMLEMFGTNVRRKLFFEDAASGWLSGRFGRRYHGFQTSSGIGCTTLFSLIPGIFITSIDIAYRNSDRSAYASTANAVWSKLLFEAVEYARQEYGITEPNPFGDFVDFPTYSWRGRSVRSLVSFGSDDQGGWDQQEDGGEDAIIQALNNTVVQKWRERVHATFEIGEGSHFGIVRTNTGFKADVTSSDWKWCFCERKSVGDLIALGATVAFAKTPGLEDDVQAALDVIGGGSTQAYWLGAEVALSILRDHPEFCQRIIDYNYPKESPAGRRMSEMLEEIGLATEETNYLDDDVTRQIVTTYISFLGGRVE